MQNIKLSKRTMKRLVAAIILLIILLFSVTVGKDKNTGILAFITDQIPGGQVLKTGTYRVTKFNDGDTITIDMDGREEKIRFIGVDTPETEDPRKPIQCFGKAASRYTKELIGNNPVRLEADILNSNRDRYNRLLRYVYLPDGTLVNARIISDGYGFAYTSFPFERLDEFRKLQTQARQNNRGLWSNCDPEKNQYGGYTSNPAN